MGERPTDHKGLRYAQAGQQLVFQGIAFPHDPPKLPRGLTKRRALWLCANAIRECRRVCGPENHGHWRLLCQVEAMFIRSLENTRAQEASRSARTMSESGDADDSLLIPEVGSGCFTGPPGP